MSNPYEFKFYYASQRSDNPIAIFSNIILTEFNDGIDSTINNSSVFGRTDPIYVFGGNKRTISLSFINLSSTLEMIDNLAVALYPTYKTSDISQQKVLFSPPILIADFGGLVNYPVFGYLNGLKRSWSSPSDLSNTPVLRKAEGSGQYDYLSPRFSEVSLTFNVIHSKAIGYDYDDNKFKGDAFLGSNKPGIGGSSGGGGSPGDSSE
jgi:hypothetical protein